MKKKLGLSVAAILASTVSVSAMAFQAKDMSDPLAVYSQIGYGLTDKGANLKLGQSYNTGDARTQGMNVLELKGFGGETLGIRDADDEAFPTLDDSIDSIRLRNFQANTKSGQGRQIDLNYSVDTEILNASYSLMKGLPKYGSVTIYPLAGVGVTFADDEVEGFEYEGAFGLVGMYAKMDIANGVWINYNPMYTHGLSGVEFYKENMFNDERGLLNHEVALSFQVTKKSTLRYFANWNDNVDFGDADHRIEYNYQF